MTRNKPIKAFKMISTKIIKLKMTRKLKLFNQMYKGKYSKITLTIQVAIPIKLMIAWIYRMSKGRFKINPRKFHKSSNFNNQNNNQKWKDKISKQMLCKYFFVVIARIGNSKFSWLNKLLLNLYIIINN